MNSVFFYETLDLQLLRLTVAFKVHKVEALSNFAGDQPEDLSFKKGDVLTILDPRWVKLQYTGDPVTLQTSHSSRVTEVWGAGTSERGRSRGKERRETAENQTAVGSLHKVTIFLF